MSEAAFADIPNKVMPRTVRLKDPTLKSSRAVKWIYIGYCEKLIDKNTRLQEHLTQFVGRYDDPQCWDRLTRGQQVLFSLAALDGQVNNGGLGQFFWNCPDLILPASDALDSIDFPELAAAYEQFVNRLVGRKDDWKEFRQKSVDDPDSYWEQFEAACDLLNCTEFNDAYFCGRSQTLVALLVDYVRSNKFDFIEPCEA